MSIARICRHLMTPDWRVRNAFPARTLAAIHAAIQRAEAAHSGEIRFAVEGALDGAPLFRNQPARDRAIDMFSHLRVWDTEHNNGVLVYVLYADRDVEIVADRGIHAHIESKTWETICHAMEAHFQAGRFEQGAVTGIDAIAQQLRHHFPAFGRYGNQVADQPIIL